MVVPTVSVPVELKLLLSESKVFPWFHDGNIHFRGYYSIDKRFYSGAECLKEFLCCRDREEVIKLVAEINGFFGLIYATDSEILIATDRLRALPLFYSVKYGNVLVGDSVGLLRLAHPIRALDDMALKEFRMTSLFVTGSKLLLKDIYQVQAGEYVLFKLPTLERTAAFYYRYNHRTVSDIRIEEKKLEFDRIYYDEVGKTLVNSINGLMAVIPLSGGADSRMILSMLKRNKYENVFCFTYGNRLSQEAKISEQVAEHFGYKWFCVEYSKRSWKEIIDNGVYENYLRQAGNYSSCPHVQDLFAVYYLNKERLLPGNAVFVPGHSGDMLAGSHLTWKFFEKEKVHQAWLVKNIIEKHYPFFEKIGVSRETMTGIIMQNLEKKVIYSMATAASEFEYFNMIERQAKFICNSVRVYEYFGYNWRMPLWDNRLLNFWSQIPIGLKYKRELYFYCIGKETVVSTNRMTARKKIAEFIRNNIRPVTFMARVLYRIREYFFHPFQWGKIVPFGTYLLFIFRYGERFRFNVLVMEAYLKLVFREDERDYEQNSTGKPTR